MLRAQRTASFVLNRVNWALACNPTQASRFNHSASGNTTRTKWHGTIPPGSRVLAASNPVTISDDRKTVELRFDDDETSKHRIQPTPKAVLKTLQDNLAKLLFPGTTMLIDNTKQGSTRLLYGTKCWQLDADGDAIHRHVFLSSVQDCEDVETAIGQVADTMGHHPHIARGSPHDNAESWMTITCTTHSPRGLSVRDTRLAFEIDRVLAKFDSTLPQDNSLSGDDLEKSGHEIETQCNRLISANRDKINRALEDCGCETAKAQNR